jgi:hypothetical protein
LSVTKGASDLWEIPARAIEEAVQVWAGTSDRQIKAISLDGLLDLGILLGALAEKIQRHLWERLLSARLAETQRAGHDLRRMYDANLHAFALAERCLRDAESQGANPTRAGAFREAWRRVLELNEDFSRRWPLFRREELEAGRAQIARGESVTSEEFLRELDGQGRG